MKNYRKLIDKKKACSHILKQKFHYNSIYRIMSKNTTYFTFIKGNNKFKMINSLRYAVKKPRCFNRRLFWGFTRNPSWYQMNKDSEIRLSKEFGNQTKSLSKEFGNQTKSLSKEFENQTKEFGNQTKSLEKILVSTFETKLASLQTSILAKLAGMLTLALGAYQALKG
jgi:hypothetical protein